MGETGHESFIEYTPSFRSKCTKRVTSVGRRPSLLPLLFRARSQRPRCSPSSLYTSMFNRIERRPIEGEREGGGREGGTAAWGS